MSGVIIYLASLPPPPRGVNEGQLIRDLCGPLRRWRWLPWLQARGASCASINGGMCCGVGGGYSLQGVSSGSSWPSRQRPHIWNSWLGCHCVEPHWSSGSTAGTRGGVPPPRAGTAVYFKLMLTPRSSSSINCEQFNQSVSSCLKIFE